MFFSSENRRCPVLHSVAIKKLITKLIATISSVGVSQFCKLSIDLNFSRGHPLIFNNFTVPLKTRKWSLGDQVIPGIFVTNLQPTTVNDLEKKAESTIAGSLSSESSNARGQGKRGNVARKRRKTHQRQRRKNENWNWTNSIQRLAFPHSNKRVKEFIFRSRNLQMKIRTSDLIAEQCQQVLIVLIKKLLATYCYIHLCALQFFINI
ncbi:hypothetical protein WN51_12468 [Melipona quadrifasciata]|uniref:Uncharacterized protein n=1 Tax=Melipona quadrifasciata TaxID=166423 RepID=A0A0N0BHN7_9HYME|nr:hypothetical protein WN51_12468 [Melipona quadrifasciata]